MSEQPDVTFVIVSWNVRELLRRCLKSIADQTKLGYEIIVIDNNSRDGSPEMVAAEFKAVKLIRNRENLGFARANNQGLEMAAGKFVFFLNCDTELIEDAATELVVAASEKSVGIVGPEILYSDYTHQQSVRRFPGFSDQLIVLLKLRHILGWTTTMKSYLADPGAAQREPLAVDQVMGAAIMMRTELARELGGFDPGYPNWFEEVDLCQRVKRTGYRVVYWPLTKVIHHGGSSFGQVLSIKKHRWILTGLRRYTKKFWPAWQARILWPFTGLSYLLTIAQTIVKPR
jgi:GT2 family glycosyltransferase